MIELFVFGFIAFFIWIIWLFLRKKRPDNVKDLEIELMNEFHEKEKQHLLLVQELKIEHQEELNSMQKEHVHAEKGFRKDAVKRSRNTLIGKLWETVAPYLPKFKYNPSDMRFIGSPIDYIIFKGMSKKQIDSVVFLEIKSGDSKLTEQEENLKRAVRAGRVKWEEFRIK